MDNTFNMSHPKIGKEPVLTKQFHEVFKWFSLSLFDLGF